MNINTLSDILERHNFCNINLRSDYGDLRLIPVLNSTPLDILLPTDPLAQEVFHKCISNGSMAAKQALGMLTSSRSALFVCDVQERFRTVISGMPSVIDTTKRMVTAPD